MGTLKTEINFHFNEQNWNVSSYVSQKYQLDFKNQHPEISFSLFSLDSIPPSSASLCLTGMIFQKNHCIDFIFDPGKSMWLQSNSVEKIKCIELLENLFLFMSPMGDRDEHV